jgi:hypothetical protein
MILSSQRVSYFGTPAGTVGGQFIPFERLFRDDPLLFGLPTVTSIAVDIDFRATVTRTKWTELRAKIPLLKTYFMCVEQVNHLGGING